MAKYTNQDGAVVDAHKLPDKGDWGGKLYAFMKWALEMRLPYVSEKDESMSIRTDEGEVTAQPGDWIVKFADGTFAPWQPEFFDKEFALADLEPETANGMPLGTYGNGY